jgi:hypothetical protein
MAWWITVPIGLACPQPPCLPQPDSRAPTSLICPNVEEEGSVLVLGIGLWFWQSVFKFLSLSFIYQSIVILLFRSTDNFYLLFFSIIFLSK